MVDHDITGLLVPVRDPGALEAAIGALASDPERRARMAAASRAKAVAEFDDRHQIAITLDVHDRLRDDRPVRTRGPAKSGTIDHLRCAEASTGR